MTKVLLKNNRSVVPNLFIVADRLTLDNITAAPGEGIESSYSKLGGVHASIRVLSSVTVIHVTNSIDISCTARYELIN